MAPGKITKDKSLILDLPKEKPTKPSTDMSHFDKDKSFFHIMTHAEPHNIRREKILEKYPEVKKLLEKDPSSLYFTIAINLFQFGMICFVNKYVESWLYLILLTYFVSATANHALFVLMHDITHFTCFKSIFSNQIVGILTNIPQCIPNAVSFGRYHRDHHTYLGHEVDDPDIPVLLEIQTFNNPLKKMIFLAIMPFFYALRPYFKSPKIQNKMEILNIIVIVITDYLIIKYFGGKCFFYLIVGTLWGLSINPVAAHIIAEHYEFNKSQDTYSYYGWLNYLSFNIGLHLEHHDFPNISWRKLPQLRKIAPEFYETLPQVDSYVKVYLKYIFDSDMGPWSRIVRYEDGEKIEDKSK